MPPKTSPSNPARPPTVPLPFTFGTGAALNNAQASTSSSASGTGAGAGGAGGTGGSIGGFNFNLTPPTNGRSTHRRWSDGGSEDKKKRKGDPSSVNPQHASPTTYSSSSFYSSHLLQPKSNPNASPQPRLKLKPKPKPKSKPAPKAALTPQEKISAASLSDEALQRQASMSMLPVCAVCCDPLCMVEEGSLGESEIGVWRSCGHAFHRRCLIQVIKSHASLHLLLPSNPAHTLKCPYCNMAAKKCDPTSPKRRCPNLSPVPVNPSTPASKPSPCTCPPYKKIFLPTEHPSPTSILPLDIYPTPLSPLAARLNLVALAQYTGMEVEEFVGRMEKDLGGAMASGVAGKEGWKGFWKMYGKGAKGGLEGGKGGVEGMLQEVEGVVKKIQVEKSMRPPTALINVVSKLNDITTAACVATENASTLTQSVKQLEERSSYLKLQVEVAQKELARVNKEIMKKGEMISLERHHDLMKHVHAQFTREVMAHGDTKRDFREVKMEMEALRGENRRLAAAEKRLRGIVEVAALTKLKAAERAADRKSLENHFARLKLDSKLKKNNISTLNAREPIVYNKTLSATSFNFGAPSTPTTAITPAATSTASASSAAFRFGNDSHKNEPQPATFTFGGGNHDGSGASRVIPSGLFDFRASTSSSNPTHALPTGISRGTDLLRAPTSGSSAVRPDTDSTGGPVRSMLDPVTGRLRIFTFNMGSK